jgi:hypothetical protein
VTVFAGLSSKLAATVFSSLISKLVATVSSDLGLKTGCYGFGDLGLKITVMVSCFGPQNQACFGLSVAPQNRRREVAAGHASRSNGLFDVKASLARISQSGLKTDGGVTTGGARGTIAEVA